MNNEMYSKTEKFDLEYMCFCDDMLKHYEENNEPYHVKGEVKIDLNVPIGYVDIQYSLSKSIYKCPFCGSELIPVDKNIWEPVAKLNAKGYKTAFSCEGHSFEDSSYILFDFSFNDDTVKKIGHPDKWFIDNGFFNGRAVIRPLYFYCCEEYFTKQGITFEEVKKESIDNLNKWIDNLPNFSEL